MVRRQRSFLSRCRSTCRPTATSTCPNRTAAAERGGATCSGRTRRTVAPALAEAGRLQPADRRSCSAIGGYYLGWFIGHQLHAASLGFFADTDQNDVALFLGYLLGVVGFLVGLGFANYPLSRLLGKPASLREKETEGIGRYFGLCTDHKVVGMQYFVGIGLFFFIGGAERDADPLRAAAGRSRTSGRRATT